MVALSQFQIIRYWSKSPATMRRAAGVRDLIALISQPRIDGRGEANVSVRGLKLAGLALRRR